MKAKQVTWHDLWSIANHNGMPWTSQLFQSEDEALAYLEKRKNSLGAHLLSGHKVVSVTATIRINGNSPKKAASE